MLTLQNQPCFNIVNTIHVQFFVLVWLGTAIDYLCYMCRKEINLSVN